MASEKTRRNYLRKGLVFAIQGQRAHPDYSALEALCWHAEDRTSILKASSIRSYWQQYARAVVKLGDDGELSKADMSDALSRIRGALVRLKGKPSIPRTSSKKVRDPQDWMVKQVFGHLKLMTVKYGRIRSAACALYCLLVPKLGTRPVELTGAWVDGNVLHIPTAKQAADDNPVRPIDISSFHPTHRAALVALISIVAADVEATGYDAWLKTLAEILARACESASKKSDHPIPRLSPSAFRHTAISTWHAAGYTPEEIAELAGHRHLRSQSHYKRSSSAWKVTNDLVKPVVTLPQPPVRPATTARSSLAQTSRHLGARDTALPGSAMDGMSATDADRVDYTDDPTSPNDRPAGDDAAPSFSPRGPGW